ncbi:MAG: ABC transporter substrate-binding protein [Dehalococcoidia bacterium]|jgi:iron complex transport system substrate-binding protein|nr:ABC transporter substrate-binding protein [Dehalococcoidia bacterium]
MSHAWSRWLLAVGTITILLIGACTNDDDEATATPTAEPSAAATATATPTEAAAAAPTETATEYPLTVRDLLGREVIIEAAPQRIVTTSPSAIEMLYAAGGEAIARSETSAHPDGVAGLPSIGPSYAPAFEAILELGPDLVLADASAQAHLAEAFDGALRGIPVVFIGAVAYEDVATSISLIGELIDNQDAADTAAAELGTVLEEVQALSAGETSPRVLIMNGAINDFFVALPDSFVGNLVALAGGENVAAGQPQIGRFPGYSQLSLEAIVEADPEVILTITAGPPPTLAELVLQDATFADLTAVLDGRVHGLDLEVYLQAPGPRAADGLKELSALLFGAD